MLLLLFVLAVLVRLERGLCSAAVMTGLLFPPQRSLVVDPFPSIVSGEECDESVDIDGIDEGGDDSLDDGLMGWRVPDTSPTSASRYSKLLRQAARSL